MAELRKRGIITKVRKLKTVADGRGRPVHPRLPRLSAPTFKDEVLAGEQPAIVERELFDAVQARLTEQNNNHTATRMRSEALLAGLIFDDRGNRLNPTYAREHGIKYRYYVSSALLQGQRRQAGSVHRIPAAEIEAQVVQAVREHVALPTSMDDRDLISGHVTCVEVQPDRLVIQLARPTTSKRRTGTAKNVLHVRWQKIPARRRHEFLTSGRAPAVRSTRSETWATLVASITRGRRWLDELVANPAATAESIAAREGCSPRRST